MSKSLFVMCIASAAFLKGGACSGGCSSPVSDPAGSTSRPMSRALDNVCCKKRQNNHIKKKCKESKSNMNVKTNDENNEHSTDSRNVQDVLLPKVEGAEVTS